MFGMGGKDDLPDELLPFKARLSPRFHEVRSMLISFITEVILPARAAYKEQLKSVEKFAQAPLLKDLREEARKRKLLNLFLPQVSGLSTLEYAPLAEMLGPLPLANAAMNCSAPDTGNMEVLERFGTEAQKTEWLEPLLEGKIRSCFAMTEPAVASSDATNIATTIVKDPRTNEYVINGHKWWISGAIRPECKLIVLVGVTNPSAATHKRQSVVLIPRDAQGVKILRPMALFGHEHDHAEILFDNVRVPCSSLVLGEGMGFHIAQSRLGPGRIHHCMRSIGLAEMALAAMVYRAQRRSAFGSILAEKDGIKAQVAEARIEITKCRQLCYLAAVAMDENGPKKARRWVSMIKVAAPSMALKVIDNCIQLHGAHGLSQDSRLSEMYMGVRTLRLADGPDAVHLNVIAKHEFAPSNSAMSYLGRAVSGENKNIEFYREVRSRGISPLPVSNL